MDKNLHTLLSQKSKISHRVYLFCITTSFFTRPELLWLWTLATIEIMFVTSLLRCRNVGPLLQLGYEYAALLTRLRPCSTTMVGLCAYGWLWYCQDKQIRSFLLRNCCKSHTIFQREHCHCGIVHYSFLIASRGLV